MGLGKKLKKLVNKLVDKFKAWVDEQNAAADAAAGQWDGPSEDYEAPNAQEIHDALYKDLAAVPLKACVRASCWDGNNAEKRYMNMLSPKFSDSKFGEYLAWTIGKGCDHVHLLLMNEGDGEGSGYDCGDDSTLKKAEERIMTIRAKGLGVILWIVADDSSNYRKKLFADPSKYVGRMAPLLKYASCVCLGLEMDEGGASESNWKGVKSALLKVWSGPVATHHTSAKYSFIGLGEVVMDQLDPSCTTAKIKSSVKALRNNGKTVFGFEYSRKPDAAKAQAALDAGAQGVGNWAGGNKPISTAAAQEKEVDGTAVGETAAATTHDDAVDYSLLQWSYGGFKGGGAKLSDKARIKNLKVSSAGMSYSWASGGCENLDSASTHANPACTCALFCQINGKWIGGKFEHISTDRTSRDFGNISDGYVGWDPAAISKATAYAFVILDDGAKRRTNVIACKR